MPAEKLPLIKALREQYGDFGKQLLVPVLVHVPVLLFKEKEKRRVSESVQLGPDNSSRVTSSQLTMQWATSDA